MQKWESPFAKYNDYNILINQKEIDLAYVYVPDAKGNYINLAILAGCPAIDVSKYLSETAPAPAPAPTGDTVEGNNVKALHVYVEPLKNPGNKAWFIDTLDVTYGLFYFFLRETFEFPDFNIYFKYCNQNNAFFDHHNIIICNEHVIELLNKGLEKSLPWTFFHEVGHALLYFWDDPLYNNEDVADEFATVILLMMGNEGEKIILEAVNNWKTHPSFFESISKLFADDRHTVSVQRARNITNWVSNSETLKKQWLKKLMPHMHTKALKRMFAKPDPWMDVNLIEKELHKRELTQR